jgi:hypothetical protein
VSEPSEVFKPLRLSGGRFDEASTGTVVFPLEVIAELARYERLLIKVARELWMDEHPTRKRAPKGFDEHLRLRLTAVETGSVGPVLQRREAEGGQLFDPDDWQNGHSRRSRMRSRPSSKSSRCLPRFPPLRPRALSSSEAASALTRSATSHGPTAPR